MGYAWGCGFGHGFKMNNWELWGIALLICAVSIPSFVLLYLYEKPAAPASPPLYEQVITRFAQEHSYNNNISAGPIYNCVNYSSDLTKTLTDLGYDASTKIVRNGSHEIITLTLDIEPQTAKVILE